MATLADSQTEQPLVERDFRFDMACTDVGECVSQRLADDAESFVPDDRIQVPHRTFHEQAEGRAVPAREFVS